MRIPVYRSTGQLVAVVFALSSIIAQATIGIMGITIVPNEDPSSIRLWTLRCDSMPVERAEMQFDSNRLPGTRDGSRILAAQSQADSGHTATNPYQGAPWLSMIKAKSQKGRKWAVLTFDDGPSASYTPGILDILKDEGVHAVFFVIGIQAEARPELLTRIADEGHEIGNHTYSHLNPALASHEELVNEIRRTSEIVEQATGSPTVWFRPPGGSMSPEMLKAVESTEHQVVLWNIDTEDWRVARLEHGNELVLEAVTGAAVPEVTVVLMHDGGGPRNATVSALRPIIKHLKDNGYIVCSLIELAQETAQSPTAPPQL